MKQMHWEDRECLEVLIDAYGLDRVLAEISHIRDSKANVVQLHAERMRIAAESDQEPACRVCSHTCFSCGGWNRRSNDLRQDRTQAERGMAEPG